MVLKKDEDGAYEVCLKTGDAGEDGTELFKSDPKILGHRYVGPYVHLEPTLAYVLEDERGVCGYVLGAFDSIAFFQKFQNQWIPKILAQHPNKPQKSNNPVDDLIREFHEFKPEYQSDLILNFPSHFHIDLLKRAQRRGLGTKMVTLMLNELKQRGSIGVHLEMSDKNDKAFAFYKKMGFIELKREPGVIFMGIKF